jgi:rhodanese-related sulfurtransferase
MRKCISAGAAVSILFFASAIMAQYLTVGADQVRSLMTGGKKAVLVDVRPSEEYQAGHIPGSINIPAERIAVEKNRLPKDRAVPIIFYCRGVG